MLAGSFLPAVHDWHMKTFLSLSIRPGFLSVFSSVMTLDVCGFRSPASRASPKPFCCAASSKPYSISMKNEVLQHRSQHFPARL